MQQLDFLESPPLNTPWRPTTPSRSCLCPVTADVVGIDQIGHDWVSNFVSHSLNVNIDNYYGKLV